LLCFARRALSARFRERIGTTGPGNARVSRP
jgi:hypothetical protein